MFRKITLLAMLACAGMATRSFAQENLLGELYGLGVHSFYAGEYREAFDNLSACIEGGSRDPRAYYFRGLTLDYLGQSEEARADFEKGAMLEVTGGGEQYPIGRSLERIQGTQRLTLERVRKIARIKQAQAELAKNKERYEESRVIEEPTLGNQPDPATTDERVEELVGPGTDIDSNPFPGGGLGAGEVQPASAVEPAVGGGEKVSDPFGDEPPPPAVGDPAAGGADPFGDEPATPAGGNDPFGDAPHPAPGPGAGVDDPFGAAPAVEPGPAVGGGDPFGGGAPTVDPAPAAGGDPFGGGAPAVDPAPADAGDPFGAGPAAGGPAAGEGVVGGVIDAIEEAGKPDGRDPFDDTDEPKAAPPVDGGPAAGGGDPFGGGAGAADPGPAPAAGDADPFGGAAPADDPFEAPADAPAAGNDPFGAAPAADEDMKKDPFGDDPADAPAVGGGDPFGAGPATPADAPVENPASDDPFADPAG